MSQADGQTQAKAEDKRGGLVLTVLAVGALTAYPPLYVMLRGGLRGMLNGIAGDTYLYMAIARHSADKPIYTFDQTHPTNGFHPLWQYLLEAAFGFVSTRAGQVTLTYGLSTLLLTLGAMFAAAAVFRFTRSTLLSLSIVPGAYYALLGAQFRSQSLWSFADGMESSLSVFWGGVLFFVLASGLRASEGRSSRELLREQGLFRRMGLVLAPLVLSRLDDVFLVFSLGLVVLALEGELRDKLRALLWLGVPTGLSLVVYLAYNQLTVGAAMPLSGATKSGVALPAGLLLAFTTLFPPAIDLKNALTSKPSDALMFFQNEFRALMMLLPVAVGGVYAFVVFRLKKKQVVYLLPVGVALHLVIKGLYNLVNVNPWHQGTWYYALSVLSCSVLCAWLLRDAAQKLEAAREARAILLGAWVVYALVTGGQHAQQLVLGSDYGERVYKQRNRIEKALHEAGVLGLLNFDDGITGFMFNVPALHGWAFATDREAFDAYQRGEFLKLAHARGHDVLTSLDYFPIDRKLTTSDEIRQHFASGPFPVEIRAELERFEFAPVYEDLSLRAGFYRMIPR